MRGPFIELLRKHRELYAPIYSELFGVLVDATLDDEPFRHEAVWRDLLRPNEYWHYLGEGPLEQCDSWDSNSDVAAGTAEMLIERIPRATWLLRLLCGDDAAAMHVWVTYLGDRDSEPETPTSVGEQLRAGFAAFFANQPLPAIAVDDPLVNDAYALIDRANAGPSPAWVDAWDLADVRERWMFRLQERGSKLEFEGLGPWAKDAGLDAKILSVGASELTLGEAVERFEADPSIDGLSIPPGMGSAPLIDLAKSPSVGRLRALLGASPLPQFTSVSVVRPHVDLKCLGALGLQFEALLGLGYIGPEGFAELARAPAFEALRWLEATGASAGEQGAIPWLESGRTRHLRVLALSKPSMGEVPEGMDAFVGADWSSLRVLEIRDNEAMLTPRAIAFAENPTLGPLRHLGLEASALEPEGVRAIAGCPRLAGLGVLDLHRNRCGVVGTTAIAQSPHLTNLQVLRVCFAQDEGVAALAAEGRFKKMSQLSITRSAITREGIRALAGAEWLRTVRTLNLETNDIDDAGARALAASPHLSSLERLQLHENPLTAKGVRALLRANLPSLRYLGVHGVKVRGSTRIAIEKMRPEVEVMI